MFDILKSLDRSKYLKTGKKKKEKITNIYILYSLKWNKKVENKLKV